MKKSALGMIVAVLMVCGVVSVVFLGKDASPKPHTVTLTWHPSASAGVTYNVYRSTTSGGPYAKLVSGLTSPKYDDTVVNGGRKYFYVVTSVDAAGKESRHSKEISAAVP